MPCGKYRRDQFGSQADYAAHRERMMKLILGDDWEDKPLAQLVAEHPELRSTSLADLLHQAHHLEHPELPPAKPWIAEVIATSSSTPETHQHPHTPLAIEGGKHQETAEEWIARHLNDKAPVN